MKGQAQENKRKSIDKMVQRVLRDTALVSTLGRAADRSSNRKCEVIRSGDKGVKEESRSDRRRRLSKISVVEMMDLLESSTKHHPPSHNSRAKQHKKMSYSFSCTGRHSNTGFMGRMSQGQGKEVPPVGYYYPRYHVVEEKAKVMVLMNANSTIRSASERMDRRSQQSCNDQEYPETISEGDQLQETGEQNSRPTFEETQFPQYDPESPKSAEDTNPRLSEDISNWIEKRRSQSPIKGTSAFVSKTTRDTRYSETPSIGAYWPDCDPVKLEVRPNLITPLDKQMGRERGSKLFKPSPYGTLQYDPKYSAIDTRIGGHICFEKIATRATQRKATRIGIELALSDVDSNPKIKLPAHNRFYDVSRTVYCFSTTCIVGLSFCLSRLSTLKYRGA